MSSADLHGLRTVLSRRSGVAAFLVVILSWASMPLFLKYFTGLLDGWTVNGVRYTIAALLALPYLLLRVRAGEVSPGLYRDALIPAGCNIAGQICWGLSPYFNHASIMHFIGRSTFLFMIVFGYVLLHEERKLIARPLFWLGALGTVSGVVAMFLGGTAQGSTSTTGVLLLLGAGAGWAAYGVAVKRCMGRHSARLSFCVISLYTAPVLLALMFGLGDWPRIATLEAPDWFWIVLSAVTAITLAHTLLYVVIKHYGPIVTDGVLQVIPFVTVVGAYLLFGEVLTGLQWFGGTLLVGGSFALLRAKRQTLLVAGG